MSQGAKNYQSMSKHELIAEIHKLLKEVATLKKGKRVSKPGVVMTGDELDSVLDEIDANDEKNPLYVGKGKKATISKGDDLSEIGELFAYYAFFKGYGHTKKGGKEDFCEDLSEFNVSQKEASQ